ncbi:MAG TPA: hypothetical protein VLZ81_14710 [Blastocatellia bacterium]|nr:hypothetical protein [Blastocatellia bacterium]
MKKSILKVLATAAAAAILLCSVTAFPQSSKTPSARNVSTTGAPPHPLITRAINACENAKGALQDAAHDFCGHRVEALGAVDNALGLLHRAIECQEGHADVVSLPLPSNDFDNVSTGGGQPFPRIRQAINALQNARADLADAAHVYCGHRAEALGAVDHALDQLHKAVECAKG